MTEPWQERAPARASWRGIPFETEDSSSEYGQRLVVREYPYRQTPSTDALGRLARRFTLTAYVVGPNYDLDRDRLTAAAERGESGTLVHPELGALDVRLERCTVTERSTEQRRASLQLSFVESGEQVFPVAAVDAPSAATTQAQAAAAAAGARATVTLTALESQPLWSRLEFDAFVASHSRRLSNVSGVELDATGDMRAVIAGVTDLYQALTLAASTPAAILEDIGDAFSAAVAAAERAWLSAMRTEALARAAEIAVVSSWDTYEQAATVGETVTAAIDAELADATTTDTIGTLTDLRLSFMAAILAIGWVAPHEESYTVQGVQPAHVLAYRLWADPSRDAEIVGRNAIRDPGFVHGLLTVASE